MTNEELAELIQAGERDKIQELWEQVRRFAYQQANRWARIERGGATVADLEQSSFVALLDALEGWNSSSHGTACGSEGRCQRPQDSAHNATGWTRSMVRPVWTPRFRMIRTPGPWRT